uniref:Ribosomal protein S3 n=2 Tax=Thraustochytriidae TaxID=33674 RepID=A0A481XHV2_9STRA|nr:ribosomal protein S3 [Schizochytrium sp. TIO1101]QBK37916.1 ribosomal protein S3 [Aurantiochytrium acetophilum]
MYSSIKFSDTLFTKFSYSFWFSKGLLVSKVIDTTLFSLGYLPVKSTLNFNSSYCYITLDLFQFKSSYTSALFLKAVSLLEKHISLLILAGIPTRIFIKSSAVSSESSLFETIFSLASKGFNVSHLVAKVIVTLLEKTARHSRVLDVCFSTITRVFNSSTNSRIVGLKINVQGRVNGSDRSKKIVLSLGTVSRKTFIKVTDINHSFAKTPYGVLGVKVWCSYSN